MVIVFIDLSVQDTEFTDLLLVFVSKTDLIRGQLSHFITSIMSGKYLVYFCNVQY